MRISPVEGLGDYDEVDYFGALTAREAVKVRTA
jgi:hypothetical protein